METEDLVEASVLVALNCLTIPDKCFYLPYLRVGFISERFIGVSHRYKVHKGILSSLTNTIDYFR